MTPGRRQSITCHLARVAGCALPRRASTTFCALRGRGAGPSTPRRAAARLRSLRTASKAASARSSAASPPAPLCLGVGAPHRAG
eukprot:5352387-Lingulodinium_polyedra.AAC.1